MIKLVVLSSVLALVAAKPSAIAPLGWGGWAGPLAAPLVSHVAAPVVAPVAWGAPALGAYNYRGPLSLAPTQPANILAADGRPLDTLSVNLDRAAHYTARAVDHAGAHIIGKRSAPLLTGAAWSHAARVDWPSRLVAPAPLAVAAAPLGWHAAAAPWGAWGHAGHLGHPW